MNSTAPPRLPHSPLSVRAARALGASEKRLRAPTVHRPFHGVVTAAPPTRLDEWCRAYLTVAPPGAFFSGPTAAALHGLPLPRLPSGLHVSVPAPARAPRRPGIHGHSVRVAFGDVIVQNGLQLSSAARTWCELAETSTLEDLVVTGDALARRSADRDRLHVLRDALNRFPSRRGRPALVQALGLLDPHAESPQESRLRFRLVTAGVVGFESNLPVPTASGADYRGDLVFPERRVILEYQGDHHREKEQYRRDLRRRLDLQADGWTIVELGPDDLVDAGLARRVRAILAGAADQRVGR
ncbi:hypothetical protein ACFVU2_01025 [Leifsonia sp. NPDC058194]|uniref:hypothetical protein n=1 Tax=Leifsonia sp. NPDC058194 TaxID=3346374 RepID=UPI0036D8A4BF